jgi:hypothetical protein
MVWYFNNNSTNMPALVLVVLGRFILIVRGGLSPRIASSKANIAIMGSCCSSTLPTTITVVVSLSETWRIGVGGAQIFRPYGG